MVLNISLDRCGVPPTLDEPQLSLPTWRRAEAISSCVVFTGSLLATTKTFGTDATTMIGAKSRATSKPGPFLNSSGLIVSVCGAPSTSVWPSAGARAGSALPMLPLGPLRWSATEHGPRHRRFGVGGLRLANRRQAGRRLGAGREGQGLQRAAARCLAGHVHH